MYVSMKHATFRIVFCIAWINFLPVYVYIWCVCRCFAVCQFVKKNLLLTALIHLMCFAAIWNWMHSCLFYLYFFSKLYINGIFTQWTDRHVNVSHFFIDLLLGVHNVKIFLKCFLGGCVGHCETSNHYRKTNKHEATIHLYLCMCIKCKENKIASHIGLFNAIPHSMCVCVYVLFLLQMLYIYTIVLLCILLYYTSGVILFIAS